MLSPVLDVLIGMALVFATMSLAATAINETISKTFALRGANLAKALAGALDSQTLSHLLGHFDALGMPRARSFVELFGTAKGRIEYVARDPLVALLAEQAGEVASGNRPSNILPPGLVELVRSARGDANKLKKSIEAWTDNLLAESGRCYARNANFCIFVIGLALSVWFDVSATRLADFLWHNQTVRTQVVALASREPASGAQANPGEILRAQLALPVRQGPWEPLLPDLVRKPTPEPITAFPTLFTLLGWLVTALATVAGAKFWFDALGEMLRFKPKTA